jgi:hypothetical protein
MREGVANGGRSPCRTRTRRGLTTVLALRVGGHLLGPVGTPPAVSFTAAERVVLSGSLFPARAYGTSYVACSWATQEVEHRGRGMLI